MTSILATAPLDVTDIASTVGGYVPAAAAAGLGIMAALYGVRVILRAFKSVK
jgi:hypothetical protein